MNPGERVTDEEFEKHCATYRTTGLNLYQDIRASVAIETECRRSRAAESLLRAERATLLEALKHAMSCDMPDEIDFRCKGCSAARDIIDRARS